MGFLDKVMTSADNFTTSVSNRIDSEKIDYKIREEDRKIEKEYEEIGKIVFASMKEGRQVDKSEISGPCNNILASLKEIYRLKVEKGETPEEPPSELDFEGTLMIQGMGQARPAKAEPVVEETAPVEEIPVEERTIRIMDAHAKDDQATAPEENGGPEVTEPVNVPSQPDSTEESATDGGSPLSRIQSYQSDNYSGKKI